MFLFRSEHKGAMSAVEDTAVMCIGLYELGKVIGKGNFAVVRLATHTITQMKVNKFLLYLVATFFGSPLV